MLICSKPEPNAVRGEVTVDVFVEWGKEYPDSPLVAWLGAVGRKIQNHSPSGVADPGSAVPRFGSSALSPRLVSTAHGGGEGDASDPAQGEAFRKVYTEPSDFHVGEEWFLVSKRWFLRWSFYRCVAFI